MRGGCRERIEPAWRGGPAAADAAGLAKRASLAALVTRLAHRATERFGRVASSTPVSIVWAWQASVSSYVEAGKSVVAPVPACPGCGRRLGRWSGYWRWLRCPGSDARIWRSEEHTSELQSQ